MAKLRSIRLKEKAYVFTAYGNDKEPLSAKIIFARFPQPGESFYLMERKNLFEGIDLSGGNQEAAQKRLSDKLVSLFMENVKNGSVDYKRFFAECVSRVDDLEYEGKAVTVKNFFDTLPPEAAWGIAHEAYTYANERDEFTMGESSA